MGEAARLEQSARRARATNDKGPERKEYTNQSNSHAPLRVQHPSPELKPPWRRPRNSTADPPLGSFNAPPLQMKTLLIPPLELRNDIGSVCYQKTTITTPRTLKVSRIPQRVYLQTCLAGRRGLKGESDDGSRPRVSSPALHRHVSFALGRLRPRDPVCRRARVQGTPTSPPFTVEFGSIRVMRKLRSHHPKPTKPNTSARVYTASACMIPLPPCQC